MRKGLLIRVGIDSSKESGSWVAPVNPITNEFAYVPIIELNQSILKKDFADFVEPCQKLGKPLRPFTKGETAHLDPDFSYLTYGDICGQQLNGKISYRGSPLLALNEDDLIVFYSSLDPRKTQGFEKSELIYAIIGIYVLAMKPRRAVDLFPDHRLGDENAHTRVTYTEADILATAKHSISGRLSRCIPIGELIPSGNTGAKRYFLKSDLFHKWGGVQFGDKYVEKLYLQRSGALPFFRNAEKFYSWFKEQNQPDGLPLELWQRNN
ncbi:MAG: hypothetical protein A9183_07010 [Dehalococcoides mccartyi]|uniref:Nmad3 family putative nucleotide modification protein n=1 Tax=Dehalococcoides mccartyi TaxID=61435 RepID=UPI00080600C9|nr:hypothetical protein [Dehalococcoides mccartyi]OBW62578.1 MAG: hypothetical protein A9183_07010 [Dehalococcoides mccartyi]